MAGAGLPVGAALPSGVAGADGVIWSGGVAGGVWLAGGAVAAPLVSVPALLSGAEAGAVGDMPVVAEVLAAAPVGAAEASDQSPLAFLLGEAFR